MPLILRQGNGEKLTMEDLDNNLIFLKNNSASYIKTTNPNIDWDEASMQEFVLTEETTFDFSGGDLGKELILLLNLKSTADITWPGSIKWTDSVSPSQSEGNFGLLDETFNDGDGFRRNGSDGVVWSIAIQSNDKILVGGDFNEYNGIPIGGGITRLNSDGSIDEEFGARSGFYNGDWDENGTVNVIDIQSDGKILTGGRFNEYDGIPIGGGIARLNSDGSLDETFNIGDGFYAEDDGDPARIDAIKVQPNGKILVGGYFDQYNGNSISRGITRLNSDGSLDETFNTGDGFYDDTDGSLAGIHDIKIQLDGKILVGGKFDTYKGALIGAGLVRLNSDGSLDEAFNIGEEGFDSDNRVRSIAIQADGKILVGGYFNEYDDSSIGYGIARLNSDGSLDETFNTGDGFYIDEYDDRGEVRSIVIQNDGKILVGGEFDQYDGNDISGGIARLNSDGSLDETFNTGDGFYDADPATVRDIKLQPDENIIIGGEFDEYDGDSIGIGIARLLQDKNLYVLIRFYYNGTDYIGHVSIPTQPTNNLN